MRTVEKLKIFNKSEEHGKELLAPSSESEMVRISEYASTSANQRASNLEMSSSHLSVVDDEQSNEEEETKQTEQTK